MRQHAKYTIKGYEMGRITYTHTYFINWEISNNEKKKIEVAKHRRNNPAILYIQCSGRKLYVRILHRVPLQQCI